MDKKSSLKSSALSVVPSSSSKNTVIQVSYELNSINYLINQMNLSFLVYIPLGPKVHPLEQ